MSSFALAVLSCLYMLFVNILLLSSNYSPQLSNKLEFNPAHLVYGTNILFQFKDSCVLFILSLFMYIYQQISSGILVIKLFSSSSFIFLYLCILTSTFFSYGSHPSFCVEEKKTRVRE